MVRLTLLALLFTVGCARPTPTPTTPVAEEPEETMDIPPPEELPECCHEYAQIQRLEGQRVLLKGTYESRFLTKRPEKAEQLKAEGKRSSLVSIVTKGASIMLGVYHHETGPRPAEEIDEFDGKRVRVTGTLHARTPTAYSPDGIPMQTMIGPYIDVESIKLDE
jgi:hypothetical protein